MGSGPAVAPSQFLDLLDEGSQLSDGERCLAPGPAMQKAVIAFLGALQGEQDVGSGKHLSSKLVAPHAASNVPT